MRVSIVNQQRRHREASRGLAPFAERMVRELPHPRATDLTFCLVSDRRMRSLNREFRGVDRTTDVLSFPGDGSAEPDGAIYLGDVAIAPAVAERQAREAGHRLARELKLLALHGYLHLLGFDHESDDGRMMRLQRRLERRLLPSGPRSGR